MTNKNDEMVWVLPSKILEYVGLPGVARFGGEQNQLPTFCALLLPPALKSAQDDDAQDPRALRVQAQFKRRGDVEEDPSFVQIIPYCAVIDESQQPTRILAYNRGRKGDEKRLADKWSIGIGGHIGPDDTKLHRGGFNVILAAADRELHEELADLPQKGRPVFGTMGLFYNDDSPVNAVHLGVALATSVRAEEFTKMGDGISTFKWVTAAELATMELEGWSYTMRDNFLDAVLRRSES